MKQIIIILIFLTFVIVLEPVSFAGSSKARQITGNVIAINTRSNTVTVKKKNKEVLLNFDEKTKVVQCSMKTAITDIKIGDRVTAKYAETEDKNTAKSVTIREITE